jgi:uncharacterized protein
MNMLHTQIKDEIQEALKNKDEIKLTVLRGLLASCTNELVANKRRPDEGLSDEEVLALMKRGVKQRNDSIEQFEKGGRDDLVQKEKQELTILKSYLPATMSKEEIQKVALNKKVELKVNDKSKIGILMGAVMSELKGKAEGKDVKEVIDALF